MSKLLDYTKNELITYMTKFEINLVVERCANALKSAALMPIVDLTSNHASLLALKWVLVDILLV